MRFKIHGEKEEIDEKTMTMTTIIEILGRKSIEKLIDDKIYQTFKDLEKQMSDLRNRVYSLEEQITIKRRELFKLEGKKDE